MDLQLYRIEHAPRTLPIWQTILDDLGRPSARQVGKALGVGTSTVHRWTQTDSAPRVACLALFWLTRWGRSLVDTRAANDATAAVGLVRALSEERDHMREHLAALKFAAANQPGANLDPTSINLASAFATMLKRTETAQIEAFTRALGAGSEMLQSCNPEAQKAQIEPNWKVLLEPSPRPAGPPTPSIRRYESGKAVAGIAGQSAGASLRLATDSPPIDAGTPAPATGANVFGSMVASVTGGPPGRAGDKVHPARSEPARDASETPGSLPLADRKHARPGTPGSATGLRPSTGAAPQPPKELT